MTKQTNKPAFHAYNVSEATEESKSHWTKIGAAWEHSKGEGLTITLDCIPLSGRIILRKPKAEADTVEEL